MELLLFYIGGVVVVGILASKRNRSVGMWVLLAIVISPLLAGLIVLALGEAEPERPVEYLTKEQAARWGEREPQLAPATKKCPDCAEDVKVDAKICRYCRHEFA